jgi:hypothetical protein
MPPTSPVSVVVESPTPWGAAGGSRREQIFGAFRSTVSDAVGPMAKLLELPGLSAAEPSSAHRQRAAILAAHLRPRLREPNLWREPLDPMDETARHASVERLAVRDDEWETEFARIVALARAAYGTRFAALSVIDGDHTGYVVRRGFTTRELPREQTICDTTLRAHGGLAVGDAREDPRFRDCKSVRDGAVGFYLGHRVESPEGQPVAVLCVFDPEARSLPESDVLLLRDLALAAQRRLWEIVQGRSGRTGL